MTKNERSAVLFAVCMRFAKDRSSRMQGFNQEYQSGVCASICDILKSVGDMPTAFLKILLKYKGSRKPVMEAIAEMLIVPASKNSLALSIRRSFRYRMGDTPHLLAKRMGKVTFT